MDPKGQEQVFLTIVYPSTGDMCDFLLNDSTSPVSVSFVVHNSPAAIAGLQCGDQLLLVNGHDVSTMPLSKIQSIISYSQCSPVTIKVLRQLKDVSPPSPSVRARKDHAYREAVDNACMIALGAVTDLSDEFTCQQTDKVCKNESSQDERMPVLQPPVILQNGKANEDQSMHTGSNDSLGVGDMEQNSSVTLCKPPPIPAYNPKSPDRFLLSNKPEYQMEVKKQRHWYEEVELNDQHKVDLISVDPLRANKGLPNSVHAWKKEHVLKWLQQLSPILYDQYKDDFDHHDITGHTLLHLNHSKLKSMGITNQDDRIQLGLSLAKLCLIHEYKDLEKLSVQVSWL